MISAAAYFEDLLMRVVEGMASVDEFATFMEIIRRDQDLRRRYIRAMRLHALLYCRNTQTRETVSPPAIISSTLRREGQASACPDEHSLVPRATPADSAVLGSFGSTGSHGSSGTSAPAAPAARFRKVAAFAAVVALMATGLWLATGDGQVVAAVTPVASRKSPVEIIYHWGSCNLEVPETLPGTLRMTNGRITALLSSGIELVLLGPFELEIRTPMEAKLVTGRLLADVSETSGGFMLHTPDLEMWDNGALFGVTVTDAGSDVFVFEGEVQVVESCGEPVDICRTGEGARARRDGSGAVKIASDWTAAERMLAAATERGVLKAPETALKAACQISDIWAAEWMPKVVEAPKPVPGLRGRDRARPSRATPDNLLASAQAAIANRQSPIVNRQSASGVLGPGSATIASKGAASCPPPKGTTLNSGGVAPAATTNIAAISPQKEEEEMKATAKTVAAVAAATIMGAGTLRADLPVVYDVTMQQVPNTRLVQISYKMTNANGIVTLSIETNGVAIPDSAVTRLSGDVCKVIASDPDATRTILWNAGADWPENVADSAKARVTAWSVDAPPQVMVIDLSKGTAASQQNPYPVYYYTSMAALPGGGLSNEVYTTDMLVMNKIPSGIFAMGDESTVGASVVVELTQSFYAGVYEVSQKQWFKVMGTDPAQFKSPSCPVEKVSYESVRGSAAQGAGHQWPLNDSVYFDSFMGRLRSKTGLSGFDLPTEAQWESACRAGTSTYFNDGLPGSSAAQLNELGWYNGNSEAKTHTVGLKAPNASNLYDMHGNVYELCLDWHADTLSGGTDPVGPSDGTKRVLKGGSYNHASNVCRSAARANFGTAESGQTVGFRLFNTLP